jgi:hypothetical protein
MSEKVIHAGVHVRERRLIKTERGLDALANDADGHCAVTKIQNAGCGEIQ